MGSASVAAASSSSRSSANNHLEINGVGAPEAAKLYQDIQDKAYREVYDGILYKLRQDMTKCTDNFGMDVFEFLGFTYYTDMSWPKVIACVKFKLGREWYDLECDLGNPRLNPISMETMQEKLCTAFVKKLMGLGLFMAEAHKIKNGL